MGRTRGSGRRRTGRQSDPGVAAQSPQRAYRERSNCASDVLEHECGGEEWVRYGAGLVVAARSIFRRMRCELAQLAGRIQQRNGLAGALHPGARPQISSAANCARNKYRLTGSGGRPVEPPLPMFRSKDNRPCLHDGISATRCSQAQSIARAGGFKSVHKWSGGNVFAPNHLSSPYRSDPGFVAIDELHSGSFKCAANSGQVVDRREPSALFKVADGALAQV